jgi:uncharacterized protein YjiK
MLWEQFRNVEKQKALMAQLTERSGDRLKVSSPPITVADTCYDSLNNSNGQILYFYNAANATARILKFDKTGKFIRSWGKRGQSGAVDELLQPHALAMDSRGRLFVGDRSNVRVLVLDQDFNHIATWHQFSRPSGVFIDKNDVIYVADSESGTVDPTRKAWTRGIRIGSARDGSLTAFIPDPDTTQTSTSSAEGVAVDKNGVIYGAEVGQRALKRYVRKP